MAQLSETRGVGDAGHIADTNALHRKANYVFDVLDFGAVGDGSTDDAAAFQAAIDAADTAGGGTVWIPDSNYALGTALTLKTYVALEGQSVGTLTGPGGVRLLPQVNNQVVISILGDTRFAVVRDLTIAGDGVLTGLVGIRFQGAGTDQPSLHTTIDRVNFYRLDKGIYANSTSGGFQMANTRVTTCLFAEIASYGIHLNSTNVDLWHIDLCTFSSNGDGVYLETTGLVLITASSGASEGSGTNDAFMRVGVGTGPTTLISCQAEAIDHFLMDDDSNSTTPIVLIDCTFDADIEVNGTFRHYVVIGGKSNVTPTFTGSTNDLSVTNIGATGVDIDSGMSGNPRHVIINSGVADFNVNTLGFYGATPAAKPTVTGARDDGTALADLLTELATLGLLTDSSTAS